MAPSELTFDFMAPVLRLDTGLKQHYVPIPMEIADALRSAGVRRVIATMNGYEINRGIQRRKDGESYLMLSRVILREMQAVYGDMVTVSLFPDPEPDTVEICEELRAVLDQDPEAASRYHNFPPGKKRDVAYYVNSAKRVETRVSRALEIAEKLRTYTLYGDR